MRFSTKAATCGLLSAVTVVTGAASAGAAAPNHPRQNAGCHQHDAVVSCSYTGTAETVTVPAGVTHGRVEIAGGSGGGNRNDRSGGAGAELIGELTVTPGAELTIGVGGEGGPADSSSQPGEGGWGLDNRGGGRGGMARRGIDGGGGGGASVIKVNGVQTVIASGGGGASYQYGGGTAGATAGKRGSGTYLGSEIGGYGGSPSHPHNNRAGASPATVGDGGGGGGGGYYFGEGGGIDKLSAGGGGGGGGGYWDDNQFAYAGFSTDRGNGFVRITWDVARRVRR